MALFCKSDFALGFLLTFACLIGSITGSPVPLEEVDGDSSSISLISREPRAKAANINTELLEKVNVDKYLKNERAVRQQLKCVLKNGPCDAIGKEMKKLMPHMVKDGTICDDCTPKQMEIINKIINHLKTNYPAEWAEGVKKYGAPAGI